MSNRRFIEISSAYRNRTRYPKPSQFEVPFGPPPLNRQFEQIKGVYNDNQQIITRSTSIVDPVLTGIIEYLWSGITFSSVTKEKIPPTSMQYNSGTGNISPEPTFSATIDEHDDSLSLKLIVIRNISTNVVVAAEKVISYDQSSLVIYFPNSINLTDGNSYKYRAYPEYGTVLSNSTTSSVSVSGLSSVYQTVPDYYVGYVLTIYAPVESSSLITGYNPSTRTFTLQTALLSTPTVGSYITITDPSTNSVITLPGVDACGKSILDYTQSYNGYYLVNETLSSGRRIVSSKISSYNYVTRAATLETPFTPWEISNKYSIRKTLPDEFITTTTVQTLNCLVTQQTNSFTVNVTGLDANFNYKGFQTTINGLPNTIVSATNSNTKLKFKNSFIIVAYPLPYLTLVPTFTKLGESPQLTLTTSDCIFLGSSANPTDNYYTGKYIYIYPQAVANSQTTPLKNIQGSCFYINAYIGSGYNACFIKSVDTPSVDANTQYYPSYTNTMINTQLTPGTLINIVSLARENYVPLNYNGSTVSQNEYVAYELSLVSLNIPNISLVTGSSIAYYPYVYVEFSVKNNQAPNLIYSNNPESNKAVFQVAIRDIKDKNITPFVKMSGRSMTQTIKFKPNDCLVFSVFLPNGKLFETVANDFYCPSGTNPFVQIDALVGIERIA
jgi:hypothetical protein